MSVDHNTPRQRRALLRKRVQVLAPRYVTANRIERSRLLTEFCDETGYSRKYAISLLRHSPRPDQTPLATAHRRSAYGPAEIGLLRFCWELLGRICAKRLAPFLSEILTRVSAAGALPTEFDAAVLARVAQMSASSVDRALEPYRRTPSNQFELRVPDESGHTAPMQPTSDWKESGPGFIDVTIVEHAGGGKARDGYLRTLAAVDDATGWSEFAVLLDDEPDSLVDALDRVRLRFPFPLVRVTAGPFGKAVTRAIDDYCLHEHISCLAAGHDDWIGRTHGTRRARATITRLMDDLRLQSARFGALARVYRSASTYTNFFQPIQKRVDEATRYDEARTPYQRLLATSELPEDAVLQLVARYEALNPVQVKCELDRAIAMLRGDRATLPQPVSNVKHRSARQGPGR
jgi:hypothetical protein